MTFGRQNIFALATSAQRSALHIHRISGVDSWSLLSPSLCLRQQKPEASSASSQKHLAASDVKPRHSYYLDFVDASGITIDDVVVVFYKGKASYTGEDSVEITSHGNPIISASIHSRLRELGFTDAKAGEFTHLAYLNGKLDLTQAEAVAALIESETEGGVKLARDAAEGALSQSMKSLREHMIKARAQLEAHIDFSEEEVGELQWSLIKDLTTEVRDALVVIEKSHARSKKVQNGLQLAFMGSPNAGKSSLFNSLLQEDRAIVTQTAGTTRDVVKDRLSFDGRDFVLADTAGIRKTSDEIEAIGIERSLAEAKQCDLLIGVVALESSEESCLNEAERLLKDVATMGRTHGNDILVFTKSDLAAPFQTAVIDKVTQLVSKNKKGQPAFKVTLANHNDVDALLNAMSESYDHILNSDGLAGVSSSMGLQQKAQLISQRQKDHVSQAIAFANQAIELCESQSYPEMVASELISCENSLIDLLGRIDVDEVFGSIFSSFCIGK